MPNIIINKVGFPLLYTFSKTNKTIASPLNILNIPVQKLSAEGKQQ